MKERDVGSRAEDPAAALRWDPETKWAAGSQGAPRARGMSSFGPAGGGRACISRFPAPRVTCPESDPGPRR